MISSYEKMNTSRNNVNTIKFDIFRRHVGEGVTAFQIKKDNFMILHQSK